MRTTWDSIVLGRPTLRLPSPNWVTFNWALLKASKSLTEWPPRLLLRTFIIPDTVLWRLTTKFYKTAKVMNHESCKGKPNTLKPSTAVLYLLCVHFATRNFVINFHLLFKHICLLDKIGHIS